MPALATYELTKDYAVGFWRQAPLSRARPPDARGRAGRGLRLPRPERRGQDDDAEAADAAGFPDVGPRRDSRQAGRRLSVKAPDRLPAGKPVLLRPSDRRGTADVFRRRCSATRPPNGARARRALLDEVGIGAERRLQLRKFSKGMLQRVGIAQALINDPELVIFDEPMSGLDPLGRRDVRALILRLRDRGCTVFFSSHVLSDAEALCSRVAILAKGRLMTAGRLNEMLAFQARGWELVASGVTRAAALQSISPRARVVANRRGSLRVRAAARPAARSPARGVDRRPAPRWCR